MSYLIKASGSSRSCYYRWLRDSGKREEKLDEYARLRRLYNQSMGLYGYRRLKIIYERTYHSCINGKKILRIMREIGIKAIQRRKRRNYNQATAIIRPNLLNQQFMSERLNRKWCTDTTCFIYNNSRLYLSVILDLYNREIVAYEISKRNDNQLVLRTLEKAFLKIRKVKDIIIHSDQGSQYTTEYYNKLLLSKEMVQSMSRRGNCLDNAPVECFFSHLKSETIHSRKYASEEGLKNAIEQYIKYYNKERIQKKLNYLSPVNYRDKNHYHKYPVSI